MPKKIVRWLTAEVARSRFEGCAAWAFGAVATTASIGTFAVVHQISGRMTSIGPFYITIVLIACWAGSGPAMASLLFSASFVAGVTMHMTGTPGELSLAAQVSLLLFIVCGGLMIAVCSQLRNSRDLAQRAERPLRDSKARLELAVEGARIGTWLSDEHRGQYFWDTRFLQMLGLAPGDHAAPGDALWMQRVHPEDRERALTIIKEARSRVGAFDLELRVQDPDTSEVRWLSMHGRFLGQPGERRLRSMGIALDVTERRTLAQALDRQSAELRALLEVLPVGVAIAHDPKGERVTLSPAFGVLVGLAGADNTSIHSPSDTPRPYRIGKGGQPLPPDQYPLQKVLQTAQPLRDAELQLLQDDKCLRELLVNAAPLIDSTGQIRGAISTFTDVTRLKAIQRELEEGDRRKDAFLATLAHELRNPLAPIRYAVRLLQPGTPEAVTAQAAATIERQSAQMARLLDDLLDLSRITRDAIDLKPAPIDLRDAVSEALDAVRPALEQHRHRLSVSQPGESLWVTADPTRLAQVLGNLLQNAIKYTPPGGKVDVNIDSVEGDARIRVRDSGIGIAPADQSRVFAMFSRIDKGDVGPQQGLGIGLAITKRLVELHHGRIELRSDGLGRGAEFTVYWPQAAAPDRPAELGASVVELRPSASRSVLIVDDNLDATDALAALLRLRGIRVHTAYDGRRAVELAEQIHPAVIVLDLGLPGMSGLDAARAIRAAAWRQPPYLIALTGWGQLEDRRRSADAGFDLHLTKPIEPDELLEAIVDKLRSRSSREVSGTYTSG